MCPPSCGHTTNRSSSGHGQAGVRPCLFHPERDTLGWCVAAERPPISGTDPPGFAVYYATSYTDVNFNACVMDLPVEYRVQNFATRPSCTASVMQLDDCVESVFADPTGWVGNGCAPFLTTAGCEGLIVQLLPDGGGPSDCKVPLE